MGQGLKRKKKPKEERKGCFLPLALAFSATTPQKAALPALRYFPSLLPQRTELPQRAEDSACMGVLLPSPLLPPTELPVPLPAAGGCTGPEHGSNPARQQRAPRARLTTLALRGSPPGIRPSLRIPVPKSSAAKSPPLPPSPPPTPRNREESVQNREKNQEPKTMLSNLFKKSTPSRK